jgi:hypothetical protein
MDKLTGGGVEWAVELEDQRAAFLPGETVRGTVRMNVSRAIEARAVIATLSGTEEYQYEVTERVGSGNSRIDREWAAEQLANAEVQLLGPTSLAAGDSRSLPFELAIPADAPPSFESGVLRIRWQLDVRIDTSGGDPSVQQQLTVRRPADVLLAAGAAGGADAGAGLLAERVTGSEDGTDYAITLQPSPLQGGLAFTGIVETREGLELGTTRVELKLRVWTNAAGGWGIGIELPGGLRMESKATRSVNETRTLWSGPLTEIEAGEGGRRYSFSGTLPSAPTPTLVVPHGSADALIDVVISRRLRRDIHYTRPVAIATP